MDPAFPGSWPGTQEISMIYFAFTLTITAQGNIIFAMLSKVYETT